MDAPSQLGGTDALDNGPDLIALLTSTATALAAGFGLLIVHVLWLSWRLKSETENYATQVWALLRGSGWIVVVAALGTHAGAAPALGLS